MSFSASIDNGKIEYSGQNLATVFGQKKNLLNWKFLLMILDILRFNKNAAKIMQFSLHNLVFVHVFCCCFCFCFLFFQNLERSDADAALALSLAYSEETAHKKTKSSTSTTV